MQRLFSTFPAGWPGVGLLIWRAAVGLTLIVQGSAYLDEPQGLGLAAWITLVLVLGIGGLLVLGFLTPLAGSLAILCCLGATFVPLPRGNWDLFNGNPLSLDVVVMAVAVALLGPGAFSLDSRLFGRREVIIPRWMPSPNPTLTTGR